MSPTVEIIDWIYTQNQAVKKCRGWGYSTAAKISESLSMCLETNQYGVCLQTLVKIDYQCIN